MGKSEARKKLLEAYLRLNIFSGILAFISGSRYGIILGLAVFLVSIHLGAILIYLLDLESLKVDEVVDKLVVNFLVSGEYGKKFRTS